MQRIDPISIIIYLKIYIFLQEFSAVIFFVEKVITKRVFTKDWVIMLFLFAVYELV